MKNLLKLNIIVWLLVIIIPKVKLQDIVVLNAFTDTIRFSIENNISSRSGEHIEQLHISEQGLNLLKELEDCDYEAFRYEGEEFYTIRIWSLPVQM